VSGWFDDPASSTHHSLVQWRGPQRTFCPDAIHYQWTNIEIIEDDIIIDRSCSRG